MKILSVQIENFGSYKHLEFEFQGQGLALVSGPTGAGKSTLCDIVPWILFGRTSKNGSVDEIISWNGKDSTKGTIRLELSKEVWQITRQRKPNDLFYEGVWIEDSPVRRGKDLVDTQKQIDKLLGIDADTFLAASYLHEFSLTATFFTTTAKNRRQLTEQLVDLSMPITLNLNLGEYRKQLKKEKDTIAQSLQLKRSQVELHARLIEAESFRETAFINTQKQRISKCKALQASFDKDTQIMIYESTRAYYQQKLDLEATINQAQTSVLSKEYFESEYRIITKREKACTTEICPTCGSSKDSHKKLILTKDLYALKAKESENETIKRGNQVMTNQLARLEITYNTEIAGINNRQNNFDAQLKQLESQENLHSSIIDRLLKESEQTSSEVIKLEQEIQEFNLELADIEVLLRVNDDFRSLLVKNTITELEVNTNILLTKHFDAELRIRFEQADDDKLETRIFKDGNEASFSQLSKGQRQMLKLCFGVSVMKSIALHHAVTIPAVFLDEPTDGLDEDFKTKSFGLLQDLSTEYESVFVVEHNEILKSLFMNRYDVKLVNGWSQLEAA